MKKKLLVFGMMLAIAALATGFIACSSDNDDNTPPEGTEEVVPGDNHKVLIFLSHCLMVWMPVPQLVDW